MNVKKKKIGPLIPALVEEDQGQEDLPESEDSLFYTEKPKVSQGSFVASLNSLSSSGCPQTQSDPSLFSLVLGSQACATIPDCFHPFGHPCKMDVDFGLKCVS